MQRTIALLLFSLIAISCGNELEFNTPAFQGTKNYGSWVSDSFQATLSDDGGLKIIAVNNNESLTFSTESTNVGTYTLGSSSVNSVEFEGGDFVKYSSLIDGDGKIVIENYDAINLTVTGTFMFNAHSSNGEIVNFIKGFFYKIPIVGINELEFIGSNSFSATIDSDNIQISTIGTDISDGVLKVKAINVDGTFIEVFMPEDISMGSYNLNFSTQTYANYVNMDGVVASSQYGTLTIFEHDMQFNKIKASFLFNTGNPYNVEVSNGNFIVYY